jgi:FixJ family two-component response regulator
VLNVFLGSRYGLLPKQSRATVIVVDDDASIRRALAIQLRILGFKVLVFQDAADLLAAEFPHDNACLLVDVYMPDMRGNELCEILAAAGRRLPTILMSAHDDYATRQIIRRAKPIASLFKPFDEVALVRAIRKALRESTD